MLWLLLYAAVILGSNYLMNWRGPWDFTEWRQALWLVDILRVLAVGILGPTAEEIIFRGFFFTRLARTRLGVAGAIALTAIGWGASHYTYTPGVIALLMFAGMLLGLARLKTKSVITPILMHMMWNLYAVW
jgi:membrane protease YdiL (CAAX protease family)